MEEKKEKKETKEKIFNMVLLIIIIFAICGIIFFYQTKKVGFHEDEVYTLSSSVNSQNGLMTGTDDWKSPNWRTKEYVKNYMKLLPENYFNLAAIYRNQAYDNHPPLFYTLVHFSSMFFLGKFNIYTVFLVNIIAFVLSMIVLIKILKIIDKKKLIIPVLIFYGLSMGTISMVIFQRMYMLLTFFILLYFYLNLKIYKNEFKIDKKLAFQLGITTILGFLTQYFFAIYALFIFVLMIIEMIRKKEYKKISKYIYIHIICGILGILLFVPCIKHLLFSDRGLKNLGNSNYFAHLLQYLKHLAYSFSINQNIFVISIFLLLIIGLTIWICKNNKDKFIILLTILPSIPYFLIAVKITSFQELRYVMPMIPFIVLLVFLILDKIIKFKYKDIIITIISIILVAIGLITSEPKFLYKNYDNYIKIANENKDKSFVYVIDNIFNHMQSVPEMMIYEKTLIVNKNNDEMQYLLNDQELNKEESYILSIKSYMNNQEIIEEIKEKTEFKNIELIFECKSNDSPNVVTNNLYKVSK